MVEDRKLMSIHFPSTSFEERFRIVEFAMTLGLEMTVQFDKEYGTCDCDGCTDGEDIFEGENDE